MSLFLSSFRWKLKNEKKMSANPSGQIPVFMFRRFSCFWCIFALWGYFWIECQQGGFKSAPYAFVLVLIPSFKWLLTVRPIGFPVNVKIIKSRTALVFCFHSSRDRRKGRHKNYSIYNQFYKPIIKIQIIKGHIHCLLKCESQSSSILNQ